MIKIFSGKPWLWIAIAVAAGVGSWYLTQQLTKSELPAGIASGNGRIEAVAIDIAARTSGRIMEILVQEGDVVAAGQILAHMDTLPLKAQLREARALLQRSQIAKQVAQSGVSQREAEHSVAQAVLAQRSTELDAAQRRLQRSEQLAGRNAVSLQTLDDDRARMEGARAARDAARAQVAAAEASIASARAQVIDAEADIQAAEAKIERIQVDINDSALRSPRDGRVRTPRKVARDALAQLHALGIKRMIMISGDHQKVAEAIAKDVGLDEAWGDLMPADKVEAIKKLRSEQKVAMVGDGVNDAPAMASATVGIAMGAAGSDVALETADVALMADDLNHLPFAVGLSRHTRGIILQNVFISLGVVALLVPATVLGLGIGPAVSVHEGSTLVVVVNALRLLAYRDNRRQDFAAS